MASKFVVRHLEFLAQPLDVAVDGAVVDIDLVVIGRVHEIVAALHEARTLGQTLQDQEFRDREADRPAVPGAFMALGIERELAAHQCLLLWLARAIVARVGAAQHGLHPFEQQTLRKRLADVVVGTRIEAHQLVDLLVLGGEKNHRQIAALPQSPQQFQPVHARHLDVENGEVRRVRLQRGQRGGAVSVRADMIPLLFKQHPDRGQDVSVVIDKCDRRHFGCPVRLIRV